MGAGYVLMQDGNLIVDHDEREAGAPEMSKMEKTGTYKVGREHEGVNSLRAELAALEPGKVS